MSTNEWQNISQSTNALFATDAILNRILPGVLATPKGWHSELVHSSSLSIPDDIDRTSLNNDNITTLFNDKHEEYQTYNSSDGPPMIFSSSDETDRIVNEMPSVINKSQTSFTEYNNTSATSNRLCSEPKTILTEEQRTTIANVDSRQPPPFVIHKKLPNNLVTYQQNVSVRYLQPPTPPPPGPIIIREVRPPPPPPQSPIQVRQRPPPSRTPPPLIFRERPPPVPPRPASRIIERLLPPPPRPPRRLIVERFHPCPPKPSDVIIERWLPYKRSDRRRIFYERVPLPYRPPPEPNLLIMHDQPHARVQQEFISQGVIRADPHSYLERYGTELSSSHTHSQYAHLVEQATHRLPPPPPTFHYGVHNSYLNHNQHPSSPLMSTIWERMKAASPMPHPPSPLIPTVWERMKAASPMPHPSSYHHGYSPYGYSTQYSHNDHLNSYPAYNNYATHTRDHPIMTDVASSWARDRSSAPAHSYLPSYHYAPTSHIPQTIQVKSNQELHHVLTDLTNGRVPTPLRSY